MSIRILLAGGTIDKQYNAANGALDFKTSHIEAALALGRCTAPVTVQAVLLKDSLEMDAADREALLTACQQAVETRLLITHGTDTLVETAALLARHHATKTIVLTGAMIPYIMKDSDASFNLGGAITAVQCLAPGVYIAINGEVFHWDNVRKDREALRFVKRG